MYVIKKTSDLILVIKKRMALIFQNSSNNSEALLDS